MSGKGQRFLLLARRQVCSQTCAAVQLKGAALGVRCALATRSAAPAPSVPGAGRGRGGCPLGGELPGQHLSGGQAPQAASRNSSSRSRKDPPPSSAAAPLHLLYFLLLLPWPRFSPERAAAASSQRQPRRWSLAASRNRSRWGPPASAAHSSRPRESGPAPGEGPAGKLRPGRNRPRGSSRTSAGPRARRGAGVLRRHPPGSHLRRPGVSQSPERRRRQLGAKKKKKKKSLSSISWSILTLPDPSECLTCEDEKGKAFRYQLVERPLWCVQATEHHDFLLSDLSFIYFSEVTKIRHY